jgi:formate hydrogenlyase transcriptional activator
MLLSDTVALSDRRDAEENVRQGGSAMDPLDSSVPGLSGRYQALLGMADLLAHSGDLTDLFRQFAVRLKAVASFHTVLFGIYDVTGSLMRVNVWQGPDEPCLAREVPLAESVVGWVWQNQNHMGCADTAEPTFAARFPATAALAQDTGIKSFYSFPLTHGDHRIGALGFGCVRPTAYAEEELGLLERVAKLVAVAVENTLNRQALTREKEQLQALLQVGSVLVTTNDLRQLLPAISTSLDALIKHNYFATVLQHKGGSRALARVYETAPNISSDLLIENAALPLHEILQRGTVRDGEVRTLSRSDLQGISSDHVRGIVESGVSTLCCVPLPNSTGVLQALCVGTTEQRTFNDRELDILRQLAAIMCVTLENARAYQEIAELKDKLAEEKLYLEGEIRTKLNFEQIVGDSAALKNTLASARTVATSDATVLILGETGTGKELIARAIHNLSNRRDKSFIKLNCAAIPTGLLESELFGHEKGAFTGAVMQKVGRLELANEGTLFLDEVGDIAPEVQPKLLRVLQDHEFERLGSTRTVNVNVRIIAATNRDLKRSVEAREFRRDLFYRLSVFPISVPPLRERPKDIPLLVRYFVQRFARRMNKAIETIPAETMNALVNWDWPGNVRELENFIERSVILTRGHSLMVPVSELEAPTEANIRKDFTLMAAEREHILKILREVGGVISGTRGAAARLGLKRTTLQSKMQKLGIRRQDYEN